MLIDTHVHVWLLDENHRPAVGAKNPPPKSSGSVETLVQDMDEFAVDHCVLVQASAFGWDNRYMVECMEAFPGKFKTIGLVDPLDPNNADQLWYWMNLGLSGFRLHPLYYPELPVWVDSPEHDRLWKAAADTGAILQFHMHPHHAEALNRMATRHPAVRVIVDHIGKPDVTEPPPYASFQPVLRLADRPNVYVKIGDYQIASKQPYPYEDTWPFVAALKSAFGPERMMWGTGYPREHRMVTLPDAIAYVKGLPCFTPADLEQVLGETPRKLFGF